MHGRQNTAVSGMLKQSSLFTEGARLCGEDWIFQHDNADIHTARRTNYFFQASNVCLLYHPQCSNEFSRIENLWG